DDDKLIAGAQTAASWARARRAKWTNRPLELPDAPPSDAPIAFEFEFQPPPPPAAPQPVIERAPTQQPPVTAAPIPQSPGAAPARGPAPSRVPPLVIEPLSASVHEATIESRHMPPPAAAPRTPKTSHGSAPLPRWVPVVGIGAALGIVAAAAAPYALRMLSNSRSSEVPVAVERRAEPPAIVRRPTGTLSVTSSPPGARVVVHGS